MARVWTPPYSLGINEDSHKLKQIIIHYKTPMFSIAFGYQIVTAECGICAVGSNAESFKFIELNILET